MHTTMVSQMFSVVDVKVVLTTQNDLDKSIVWDFKTQLLHWIVTALVCKFDLVTGNRFIDVYPEVGSLSYTTPKASAPGFVAITSSSLVVVPSATVPTSTVPIPNIRRSLKTTYERLDKDFV
ncbi:uncharacterized protein L203_103047 [Cryptococcus depauperatus CBS 7841]|uniref:Uncharacterized protein n=1 Tax=Cryptococcus depauperatus CBS 7841 TaxID=1295531 RepID=A0AAJ8JT25_9TREE